MPADDPILIEVSDTLSTDRLILTASRAGDGPVLNPVVCESLDHLRPWMGWAHERPTVAQSEAIARRMYAQFLQRQHLAYSVFLREPDGSQGRLVGGAGLHRLDWSVRRFEIGYWLAPQATGRGLASEAVVALTRMAFADLHARRLELRTDSLNRSSRAVAERCGFTLEGILRRESLNSSGGLCDICVYAMLALDELRTPRPAAAASVTIKRSD